MGYKFKFSGNDTFGLSISTETLYIGLKELNKEPAYHSIVITIEFSSKEPESLMDVVNNIDPANWLDVSFNGVIIVNADDGDLEQMAAVKTVSSTDVSFLYLSDLIRIILNKQLEQVPGDIKIGDITFDINKL